MLIVDGQDAIIHSFVGLFVCFQDSSWIEERDHSNYPVCLCLNNAKKMESLGPFDPTNGTDL